MHTAGKINTSPYWKFTCPVGHVRTKVYVPWDKIYMPQARLNVEPWVGPCYNVTRPYFIHTKLWNDKAGAKQIPNKLAVGVQDINLCTFMVQQSSNKVYKWTINHGHHGILAYLHSKPVVHVIVKITTLVYTLLKILLFTKIANGQAEFWYFRYYMKESLI